MTVDTPRAYRPGVDLVPEPLWGKNLRSILTASKWKALRNKLIEKHGLTCAMCGRTEKNAKQIHAHEEWHYDTDATPARAIVVGVELICGKCHAVEHFGRLRILYKRGEIGVEVLNDVIAHFCKTNDATVDEFLAHEDRVVTEWRKLCDIKDWVVDAARFV